MLVFQLQIGCIYAGTLINHLMYADGICIFSPSVAGLRKRTNCCAKYGKLFTIIYQANKSYYMVIDSKPQDMKSIHFINLNNHPLPYAMMTTLPDRKDAFMHELLF